MAESWIAWVRHPSGCVGFIAADPVTYADLLARGWIVIDGQHARVAPIVRPQPDEQYDLRVVFEHPYQPPQVRLICDDAEQAERFVQEGIIVHQGRAYVPELGDEPNVVCLLPYVRLRAVEVKAASRL